MTGADAGEFGQKSTFNGCCGEDGACVAQHIVNLRGEHAIVHYKCEDLLSSCRVDSKRRIVVMCNRRTVEIGLITAKTKRTFTANLCRDRVYRS